MNLTNAFGFSAIFSMLFLLGCGGGSADNTSESKPAEQTTTTTQATNEAPAGIPPAGAAKYSVATMGVVPPFSFQDEKGQLSGLDIDVLRAIGEVEGFTVEFFPEPFDRVFSELDTDKYQIAINGISYTPERDSKYGLSQAYFHNPSAMMYTTNLPQKPKSLGELTGLTIGVVGNTKQAEQAKSVPNAKIKTYETPFATYKAIMIGEIDVTLHDIIPLQYAVDKEPKMKEVAVIVPYESETDRATEAVIVVKKDNQELLAKINSGIDKLKANGKLDEIRKKYLGQ